MVVCRRIRYIRCIDEILDRQVRQLMDIEESKVGGVFVLELEGRLDSASARGFEERVMEVVGKGETALLIDLGNLSYISSAGLRVLLVGAKRLQQTGGKIALCSMSANIREVFQISGFLSIFAVHEDRAAALAAMG